MRTFTDISSIHSSDNFRRHLRQLWPLLIFLLFSCLAGAGWDSTGFASTVPPDNLIISKTTEPAGGTTEFTFELSGPTDPQTFSLRDGTLQSFLVQTNSAYQLHELLPSGWMQKSANCSNGNPMTTIIVGVNDIVHCQIVNVKLGTIIVNQVTEPVNDFTTSFSFSGGTLTPSAFSLKNGQSQSFVNLVPSNSYSIVQSAISGWVQANATCSDGSPANKIDVNAGETVTCTFVNKQNGALLLRKVTVPSPDRTDSSFAFTTDNTLPLNNFSLKDGESYTFTNLEPRDGYRARELAVANWRLANGSCSNGSVTTNIRVDPGATVTCTFINEGTLVDLKLAKTDGGITAEPGDVLVYKLTYRNDGTKTAAGATITEQVPNNTTFVRSGNNSVPWSCANGAPAGTLCQLTIGDLAGGTQGQVEFRVNVNSALPTNVTTINNSAKLGYIGIINIAQSSTSTPVKAAAELSLSKDDSGATVTPGGQILYTLHYANGGNQDTTGVVITETVPLYTTFVDSNQSWSCPSGAIAGTICLHTIGTVGAGKAGDITFRVKVVNSLPAQVFTIDNQAQIGRPGRPNADIGTEQTEIAASPDLTIEINENESSVAPGGLIHYKIAYTNMGTQAATNVTISANLPNNTAYVATDSSSGWVCIGSTCTFAVGALASGASNSINLAIRVDRPLPVERTTVVTTVHINDDGVNGSDEVPTDNQAQASTTVIDVGEILAKKRATLIDDQNQDGQPSPGDTLEYLITIQNPRGIAVRNVVFTDILPAELEIVPGITTSQGEIIAGTLFTDQQVKVNVGTIAADSTATIRFRVGIRTPLPANVLSVTNQGTVESSDFSTLRTDNPETAVANDGTTTPINAQAAVEASLADFLFIDANNDTLVSVGDTLIYRLTVRNRGNGGSPQLQIRVPLAENVVLLANSVTATAGVIRSGTAPDDRIVRIDIGEISGGAEVRVTFQVQIIPMSGFATVQHQAQIVEQNSPGEIDTPSDDPDTTALADATITTLNQAIITIRRLYLPIVANATQ